MDTTITDLLSLWFGSADVSAPVQPQIEKWFRPNPAFDQELRERFEGDVIAARDGHRDHWAETPAGALALVVLLDQLPRNLYRDDPRAFASDAHALTVTERAIARGLDQQVAPLARSFFYVPFEHAEDLAYQDRGVALFEALAPELPGMGQNFVDFAQKHRDIVARFGRFPHRNAALGRASTPEELKFLESGRGF